MQHRCRFCPGKIAVVSLATVLSSPPHLLAESLSMQYHKDVFDTFAQGGSPQGAVVRKDPQDGTITYLEGTDLSEEEARLEDFTSLVAGKKYGEAAIYFLQRHRQAFRLANPNREFFVRSVDIDDLGYKHVRLREQYAGLPVWGAELIVHFNKDDRIYLVNGRYMPTPVKVPKQPKLREQEVMRRFQADAKIGVVVFYDRKAAHLAYDLLVNGSTPQASEFIIDAITGHILLKLPRTNPK